MDNSQSIMSDGCKHSSQYSVGLQPVSVLAILLDKWSVLHSYSMADVKVKDASTRFY